MPRRLTNALGALLFCAFRQQLLARDTSLAAASDVEADSHGDPGDGVAVKDALGTGEKHRSTSHASASSKKIKAVVVNKQHRPVWLWWINPDSGQRHRLKKLPAGSSFTMDSFPGHKLILTERKKPAQNTAGLAEFITTEEDRQTHVFTRDGRAVNPIAEGPTTIEIRNRLGVDICVLWRNPFNGTENLISRIANNDFGRLFSFAYHALVVREGPTSADQLLREIEVSDDPIQSLILAEDGDDQESEEALSTLEQGQDALQ